MSAQKARGADFETGSLIDRAKALLPVLVPLFVSAFRRADELAIAMESRCYHGGEGRTRNEAAGHGRSGLYGPGPGRAAALGHDMPEEAGNLKSNEEHRPYPAL